MLMRGECEGGIEMNCELILNHIRHLRAYKDVDEWGNVIRGCDDGMGD